ncbi:MAG: HAMP domain-containing sensor histidine kinase [Cyanobacteria bacterium P01_E01_bin.48]
MVLGIDSIKRSSSTTFGHLRWQLLLSYLAVMAGTLAVVGAGVYGAFSRNLYALLDKKLMTLAQAAAPSHADIKAEGSSYLGAVDEVPWRDIFNRDRQSLEWFDEDGILLARKGSLQVHFPPSTGPQMLADGPNTNRVRTFTISVFNDSEAPDTPTLEGYIRASQSTAAMDEAQHQLVWGLGVGGVLALGMIGLGGLLLTHAAVRPIERNFSRLKQFTADASHELRSPLTAIKTSVEVMRNHPERIHPLDVNKLGAIASATHQMTRLTEDLLFLARADADAAPIRERLPVNLDRVLRELVELMQPQAQSRQILLSYRPCPDPDVCVIGDRAQLVRLFTNLLANALKFTSKGGAVTLYVHRFARMAVVGVEDTGVGIPAEHLPQVFQRFWRSSKSRSRQAGGAGLGLAIAQAIARQHGGDISVTSQEGIGSCFRVRLPVARRQSPIALLPPSPPQVLPSR